MTFRRYSPAPLTGLVNSVSTLTRYLLRELQKIASLMDIDDLWEDNTADLSTGNTGAGAPTLTNLNGGPYKAYVFAVGDAVNVSFHVKHDVSRNKPFYPHVHWTTDGTNAGTVTWRLHYQIAAGHQQEAFPTASTVDITQTYDNTLGAWTHMIGEVSDNAAIAMPQVDSLILMTCELEAATGFGTPADDIFGLYIDLHYQKDREGTRYKSPDFYGLEE